ncbi:protein phosphatase 2C 57 isoform X1 [Citrus sinensis]|uniref:protein phosphatase 2C 57 isoform X1 n=1 Tax=Citrus sinensis TaxID=2711 RepID=UPI00227759FC|nr:protein phosphatase 2C 57 isoform X1 [Citrus sinensis]
MALLNQQLQRFLLTRLNYNFKPTVKNNLVNTTTARAKSQCYCSAIAIDAPSSFSGVAGIRWGSVSLQGLREEMEDGAVIQSDGLDGFSFAAVFDGHGGVSTVKFLRDELYKECVAALQGGLLLSGKDFDAIKKGLQEAFENADMKLLNWLEMNAEEDESGATATVVFIGRDILFISHIGDCCVVLSRTGKADVLTNPHRPYGSSQVSLQEIRRIREAGGWISNGRICGDIAVSRAFGDFRFKTKKNEMLKKGVNEGRWSEKFVSSIFCVRRVQLNKDLVIASPDIFQVSLGSDAEFVLLASDGLWDYMNSSDAVKFVRNQLRQHGDVQLACEALARAALDQRSQDNISIVIADLGQTDWRNLPLQQQNVVYELAQAFATIGIVSLGIWMSSLLSV